MATVQATAPRRTGQFTIDAAHYYKVA